MCLDSDREDALTIYETKMAEKVNKLIGDLMRILPKSNHKRVGDKLVDFILCLTSIAQKLGSRIFGWFIKVNRQQFCDVMILLTAISQRQLLDQLRREDTMGRSQQDSNDFDKHADFRNMSLVFHVIDYVVTFDDWGLGDLVRKLDWILSSSKNSQRILHYMVKASPHIHGGSWIALTQARSYLKICRTFGDFRRLMNPTRHKFDEVIRTHAEKALLDIYHTENALRFRALLNNPDRQQIVAKTLKICHTRPYLSTLYCVDLQELPRNKRKAIVSECNRFWAQDEVQKLKRWLDEGLPGIALARGMFHLSGLGMYPSARMINAFLNTASKTKSGLDGDAIIGCTMHSLGSSPLRKAVKIWEFFSQDGISFTHLHMLGPVLSLANTKLVQQRFSNLTKYGYKCSLLNNYKSFLRYGFQVEVDKLKIKEDLRKVIATFTRKALPLEVRNRSLYLYSHLTNCYHLSDLPLQLVFQYEGIDHLFKFVRANLEKRREKILLRRQQYRERVDRKTELDLTTTLVPSE